MKRLTIGSLKESNGNAPHVQASIIITKKELKELKRILEIEQNNIHYKLEVGKDQSILDSALEKGIGLEYKCRKGTCGKCKVKIINGHSYLQPTNQLEQIKLEQQLKNGFRLACQARAK